MITITSAVREIVEMDELAKSALEAGLLNYSNYARKIQSKVASLAKKPVKLRSIIVALTRIDRSIELQEQLIPKITNLSIHTSLQELTYSRDGINEDILQRIYEAKDISKASYFVVTQSTNEITIVADEDTIDILKKDINIPPIFFTNNLVGVTIKFSIEYIDIPNVIYEFMKKLAVKKINITEVVSTTTELTFIIQSKYLETTVNQLSKSF